MIIAAAQTRPADGDTETNLQAHCRAIETAAGHGVQLLVFPEMSLTGYTREQAAALSFSENDARLARFEALSAKHGMIIMAGAPVKLKAQLFIGAFLFTPGAPAAIYTKQYLHSGEEKIFAAGFAHNPVVQLGNENIAPAICADITHPEHPEQAAKNGATVYAAGIFYTPNGIAEAYRQLAQYAEKHAMHVVMANFCGSSYGMPAAGQSACWDNSGRLLGKMNAGDEGLLIAAVNENGWTVQTIITG